VTGRGQRRAGSQSRIASHKAWNPRLDLKLEERSTLAFLVGGSTDLAIARLVHVRPPDPTTRDRVRPHDECKLQRTDPSTFLFQGEKK